jgi:hypothetical protein
MVGGSVYEGEPRPRDKYITELPAAGTSNIEHIVLKNADLIPKLFRISYVLAEA